jgi:hypothetical protein
VSGHTKWSELRDRLYAEHPGMAERVAARVAQELSELPGTEAWEVELEAEPVGNLPLEDGFRQELVQAVCDGAQVVDADIDVHLKDGKLVVMAVLFIAAVGMAEVSKRFSQAGRGAEVLRLRLEDFGSVVQQTIRRAA